MNDTKKYTVLDLFSGCGGMSLGFEKANYEILLGIDNWKIALETFKLNHKKSQTLFADLSNITPSYVRDTFIPKGIDVIIGGPPCQGFSISGKRNPDDPRNILYQAFVAFVEFFTPRAFVMENVPNLGSMLNGKVREEIIKEFESIGYNLNVDVLMASDFGVPQNRRRIFFIGTRKDLKPFEFPSPIYSDSKVSSYDAISDLPENSLPDGSKYIGTPKSRYQEIMREYSAGIYNHQTTVHTQKTVDIIAQVPDGGNYKDLPEELHHIRKVNIAWTRLNSSKPSFTIDTGHNHHFHYFYNRVPTARESARLQSFPDKFIFLGNKGDQLRQIGNAVPPILAEKIANQLKLYI